METTRLSTAWFDTTFAVPGQEEYRAAYLYAVATHPGCRGRGLAGRLLAGADDFFRTLDIPVRTLECCSGDLADLKVKSVDVEAWSPRQQKYFEVCSCSNLGDAQARRLRIRFKDENGKTQLAHTLNNTCVAPPRMLIAFLENNLQPDGSVVIPEVLRSYMGGTEVLVPKH